MQTMEAPRWTYYDYEINIDENGFFAVPPDVSKQVFSSLAEAKEAIQKRIDYIKKTNRQRKKTVEIPLLTGAGKWVTFESYDRKTGEPIFKNTQGESVNPGTTYLPSAEAQADLIEATRLATEATNLVNKHRDLRVHIRKQYVLDTVEKHDRAVEEVETMIRRAQNDYAAKQKKD